VPRPQLHRYGSDRRRNHNRSRFGGSMRLAVLFFVLVAINVYVFFLRGGTSITDVLKAGAIKSEGLKQQKKKRAAQKQKRIKGQPQDDSIVVRSTLKGHTGLASALSAMNLEPQQTTRIIAALRTKLNMRSLRPEHSFVARLDPTKRRLRSFVFNISPIARVIVERRANGSFHTRRVEQALETRVARVGGRISSSLVRSMSQAGESSPLVAKFVELFSWDINWYADPRPGDEFRIIVEKKFLGDKFYRYGNILAAEYRGKHGRHRAFYYASKAGKGDYYSADGRSIRRDFVKTPLNFRRISSKFSNRRLHPVLKRRRKHRGLDYAAPRGTPIWAASDGVVIAAKRSRGAGNYVMLKHKNHIVTAYMHMTRFARGMKAGVKVKQRQFIGTVGSTGLATGPHLHYEIRVRGKHIDPMKFKVPRGKLLSRSARQKFFTLLETMVTKLESIRTKIAAK